MCAVSYVIDQWQQPGPNSVTWTVQKPDPATAEQMLKVIELLEKIDKKLGSKDCKVKAKDKAKFKRKLKRRADASPE